MTRSLSLWSEDGHAMLQSPFRNLRRRLASVTPARKVFGSCHDGTTVIVDKASNNLELRLQAWLSELLHTSFYSNCTTSCDLCQGWRRSIVNQVDTLGEKVTILVSDYLLLVYSTTVRDSME